MLSLYDGRATDVRPSGRQRYRAHPRGRRGGPTSHLQFPKPGPSRIADAKWLVNADGTLTESESSHALGFRRSQGFLLPGAGTVTGLVMAARHCHGRESARRNSETVTTCSPFDSDQGALATAVPARGNTKRPGMMVNLDSPIW
jgi:hypothetical protein